MCDANERLDLPTALWLGRHLVDSGIYWLEEPLLSQDIEGYRRLRAALPIPLALGEHIHSRREFIPYIANDAIDIVQPDVCMIGGLSEAMKIGRVAESFGLALAPHFMTELHVHLAAALPRASYVEYYPFMGRSARRSSGCGRRPRDRSERPRPRRAIHGGRVETLSRGVSCRDLTISQDLV